MKLHYKFIYHTSVRVRHLISLSQTWYIIIVWIMILVTSDWSTLVWILFLNFLYQFFHSLNWVIFFIYEYSLISNTIHDSNCTSLFKSPCVTLSSSFAGDRVPISLHCNNGFATPGAPERHGSRASCSKTVIAIPDSKIHGKERLF